MWAWDRATSFHPPQWCVVLLSNHHGRGMGHLLCPEAKCLTCNTESHISPLFTDSALISHRQGVCECIGDCACVSVGKNESVGGDVYLSTSQSVRLFSQPSSTVLSLYICLPYYLPHIPVHSIYGVGKIYTPLPKILQLPFLPLPATALWRFYIPHLPRPQHSFPFMSLTAAEPTQAILNLVAWQVLPHCN